MVAKSVLLLPDEIITDILSRLPADSAIGCRCICKQWRSLIDHPSFRDTHTRQLISSSPYTPKKFGNYLIPNSSSSSSSFFLCAKQNGRRYKVELIEHNDDVCIGDQKSVLEFFIKPIIDTSTNHYDWFNTMLRINLFNWLLDTMFMISSCNGLVLMGSAEPNDMLVCNPFTREYVILHCPIRVKAKRGSGQSKGYMVYGFGYLPCTNEYKVVCIYYDAKRENNGKVSVYTLGSGRKWRNKGEIPYLLNVTTEYPGMLANGVIHWLTYNHEIVSFDLADEEFRVVIPLLPPSPNSDTYIDQYWVLGGCLCVCRSDKRSESPRDIWVLNHVLTTNHNNNNNKEEFSWNKKFSIPGKGINPWAATAPQIVLKSGKILFRCVDGLATYDPKSEAFIEGDGKLFLDGNTSKIIPYTKSFVSVKAFGEEEHSEPWQKYRREWFLRAKRNRF